MTEKITRLICELGIEKYILREDIYKASELYFIKKTLDAKRKVSTRTCTLTLYRDFEADGAKFTGHAELTLGGGMSDEEIKKKILSGYDAALYVKNPYYPLPQACRQSASCDDIDTDSAALACKQAIFSADVREDSFINSCEIFAKYKKTRITTSEGGDVSFCTSLVDGEIVAGSKFPEDSELVELFEHSTKELDELKSKSAQLLSDAAERARAKKLCDVGQYDIILCSAYVREMLGYTLWRSKAENIYSGYSDASRGQVQRGNIPDMTLVPTEAFSSEGVRMRELELCRDGEIKNITGNARHCYYLDTPVTGSYTKIKAVAEGVAQNKLTEGKVLYIKSFSDFQFDPLDGYFGGEVRLAYLYDNGTRIPVTGFSVSGSYNDTCESFEYSEESCSEYTYLGPAAMKIKNVSIS